MKIKKNLLAQENSLNIATMRSKREEDDTIYGVLENIGNFISPQKQGSRIDSPEINLLKQNSAAPKAKQEGGSVDQLFSFLGDFQPGLRKANINEADTLELMASNLVSEIDDLFNLKVESADLAGAQENEVQKEELRELTQEDKLKRSLERLAEEFGGAREQIKVKGFKSNPLKLAAERTAQNFDPYAWTMLEYAERYFWNQPNRKVENFEGRIRYSRVLISS